MAVKEELQQDSDLFKLLSTHHEKYSELLGLRSIGLKELGLMIWTRLCLTSNTRSTAG